MKKIAVIDIGSNSVRLMLVGKVTSKKLVMTQLGRGLITEGKLLRESIDATKDALRVFIEEAKDYTLYCFATEAVRAAANGADFIKEVKDELNLDIDLLTPEEEARAGYLGACRENGEYTVIDIGGASTEIISGRDGNIVSAISIPVGAVRLNEKCGDDEDLLDEEMQRILPELTTSNNVIAIGGTATALGAIKADIPEYKREIIHNSQLTFFDVESLIQKLKKMTAEERTARYPVLPIKRATVMVSGAVILKNIMKKYQIESLTLSDSDNAEGYLVLRSYEN